MPETPAVNPLASDNVSAICAEVLDSIAAANNGIASSYGEDDHTVNLECQLCEIFECEVKAFPVASGTATNALSLAAITPTFGKVFCHELAHINTDECGAPEFFTGGAKLVGMRGDNAKYNAATLEATIYGAGNVHHAQPASVSLTQASEAGAVYQLDEIAAISSVARDHNLAVHMDGARFANALVSLDVSPAEVTWKSGVDVLSFGGTKNGCLAAEVAVFFNTGLAGNFPFLQKRAGQLLSKSRFISCQMQAYLQDDLWLRNARHANTMASHLSETLSALPGISLAYPTQSNEVFVKMPDALVQSLKADDIHVNDEELDGAAIRFVAAWNTTEDDITQLVKAIEKHI